jgi:hypothetical protein
MAANKAPFDQNAGSDAGAFNGLPLKFRLISVCFSNHAVNCLFIDAADRVQALCLECSGEPMFLNLIRETQAPQAAFAMNSGQPERFFAPEPFLRLITVPESSHDLC